MVQLSFVRSIRVSAESSRADCWGLLASGAVHVAAIAALSWWLLPRPNGAAIPSVQTVWGPLETHLEEPPPLLQMSVRDGESAGGRTPAPSLSFESLAAAPQVHFDQRVPALPGPLVEIADLRETARVRMSGAGSGTGTGSGVGEGTGGGRSDAAEFFPTRSATGRYVFVVDCSKSMIRSYPGPARNRLSRVKLELWRTIYRMTADQKFFIVFFNTQAIPMPATSLVPAGPEGQQRLLDWTASIRASGETDPYEALLLAVRLQPDEIFFLTDGEFHYRTVREVTKSNFGGIRIHTIALGDDSGAKFLKEIASNNNGVYRHIVEDQDRYWDEGTGEEPLVSVPPPMSPASGLKESPAESSRE